MQIKDARISFISLVDKAANRRPFLIVKAEDGLASFSASGPIVKSDEERHYLTGVAYEPMTRDSDGHYMTEDEVVKAAYWFAKNGDKVDVQHSFRAFGGASVVENWVTKSSETIGCVTVPKGTWLVTVEIADDNVWQDVQKGAINGFSIGGVGVYQEDGGSVPKTAAFWPCVFKKLARRMGFDAAAGKEEETDMTREEVMALIDEAVEAAIRKRLEDSVQKAVEPILKACGMAANLNGTTLTESKPHYLTGIL